jgi:hypothetical protein
LFDFGLFFGIDAKLIPGYFGIAIFVGVLGKLASILWNF